MNILVIGGVGFIGCWVVKLFLEDGYRVIVLDNLFNGSIENIKEFEGNEFKFLEGDIKD